MPVQDRSSPRRYAERVILTHMSPHMLARAEGEPEECACDGMVVEV